MPGFDQGMGRYVSIGTDQADAIRGNPFLNVADFRWMDDPDASWDGQETNRARSTQSTASLVELPGYMLNEFSASAYADDYVASFGFEALIHEYGAIDEMSMSAYDIVLIEYEFEDDDAWEMYLNTYDQYIGIEQRGSQKAIYIYHPLYSSGGNIDTLGIPLARFPKSLRLYYVKSTLFEQFLQTSPEDAHLARVFCTNINPISDNVQKIYTRTLLTGAENYLYDRVESSPFISYDAGITAFIDDGGLSGGMYITFVAGGGDDWEVKLNPNRDYYHELIPTVRNGFYELELRPDFARYRVNAGEWEYIDISDLKNGDADWVYGWISESYGLYRLDGKYWLIGLAINNYGAPPTGVINYYFLMDVQPPTVKPFWTEIIGCDSLLIT